VAINGKKMKPHELLATLNQLGGKHGIGRLDLVENRYVGMKSRGCYETPGGTILLKAHRAIESVCLDREVAHLKDDLMPRYASLIYNGYWWSPERKALQALIDHTQQTVNGWVRLKLYKGNVIVVGRDSKTDSLFDPTIATFEDDAGAYNQKDAHGFIRLNALRMRIAANRAKAGPARRRADAERGRAAMFGISEEQLAEFGMTFGLGRLHALHAVHHRRAGMEVQGGQARHLRPVLRPGLRHAGLRRQVHHSENVGDLICRSSIMSPCQEGQRLFRRQVRQPYRAAPDGTKKSVGVILPATLTFNTGVPEIMECVSGACRYRIKGEDWKPAAPARASRCRAIRASTSKSAASPITTSAISHKRESVPCLHSTSPPKRISSR
jgi:uncharacterized protein YaiE (UPF0345 family)